MIFTLPQATVGFALANSATSENSDYLRDVLI